MEGKDEEFLFFNQSVAELVEAFPFNNSFNIEQENDFENFFAFPHMDNFVPFEQLENKNVQIGDSLLQKLTTYEENYKSLLENNILSSPTVSNLK